MGRERTLNNCVTCSLSEQMGIGNINVIRQLLKGPTDHLNLKQCFPQINDLFTVNNGPTASHN